MRSVRRVPLAACQPVHAGQPSSVHLLILYHPRTRPATDRRRADSAKGLVCVRNSSRVGRFNKRPQYGTRFPKRPDRPEKRSCRAIWHGCNAAPSRVGGQVVRDSQHILGRDRSGRHIQPRIGRFPGRPIPVMGTQASSSICLTGWGVGL